MVAEEDLEALGEGRAVDLRVGRLALDAHLIHLTRTLDDQAVVGADLLDAEQQGLDVGGKEVDSSDDQHVVESAAQGGDAGQRATAGAGHGGDRADVPRAVADQRLRLLQQGGEDELAVAALGQSLAGLGVDHLDQEMVFLDVQPVARVEALRRDPGPHISESP